MLLPIYWGPYAWHMLHSVVYYNNKSDDNSRLINFFEILGYVLPCVECQIEYQKWLDDNPVRYAPNLIDWVIDLHNSVNRKVQKNICISRSEVDQIYWKDGTINVSHWAIFRFLEIIIRDLPNSLPLDILEGYLIFFRSLKYIFPCQQCRNEYIQLLEDIQLESVSDSLGLKRWWKNIYEKWGITHVFMGETVYLGYKDSRGKLHFHKDKFKSVQRLERGTKNQLILHFNSGRRKYFKWSDNMYVWTEWELQKLRSTHPSYIATGES